MCEDYVRDTTLQRQLHSTQIREVVSVVADSKKTHMASRTCMRITERQGWSNKRSTGDSSK